MSRTENTEWKMFPYGWDDCHLCEMVEVERKISPLKSRQGGKIFPPIGLRTQ
jgi:hypothetical protein